MGLLIPISCGREGELVVCITFQSLIAKKLHKQCPYCWQNWLTHLWLHLEPSGLALILHSGHKHRHQHKHKHRKYQLGYLDSTEDLTQQYWTSLDLTIHSGIFVGQPLITTGLVFL